MPDMTFKEAVETTPDVKTCYQRGLRALGSDSKKINLGDTAKCEGSVDIDRCTLAKYPQSNRWDYCFSYRGEVFFVEVHTANTAEVSTVFRKLRWLKDWLNNEAPELAKMKVRSQNPYYWIQSSRFNIPKTSKQYRQVIQEGIKPISMLVLQ